MAIPTTYVRDFAVKEAWGKADPSPEGYLYIKSKTVVKDSVTESDEIWSCVYEPVNEPPTASLDCPRQVSVGERIRFRGGLSSDPDGEIVSYVWEFGDGTTAEGQMVVHAFRQKGRFELCLTVSDNEGAADTECCSILVMERERSDGEAGPEPGLPDTG